MTTAFSIAIGLLKDGQAVKSTNWNGYVKRVDGEGGAYQLVFKKADGTEYAYSVAADGTVSVTSPVTIDQQLMKAMMTSEWATGTVADYEAARNRQNVW